MRGEVIKRHDRAKHRYEFLAMRAWQLSDEACRIGDRGTACEVLERLSCALVDSGLVDFEPSTAKARYDSARSDWNSSATEFYRISRAFEKLEDLGSATEVYEKASSAMEKTGVIPHVSDEDIPRWPDEPPAGA